MAIRITEDGVVNYENSPDVNRKLFPNLNICGKEIDELAEEIDGKAPAVFSTASGSIASFDDGADNMPLKSCVVSFDPIQEGEGDPSPENVRPISGRTGLSVYHSGSDTSEPTAISVNWEREVGTVYGGTIDVVSGKLTVNRALKTFDGSEAWTAFTSNVESNGYRYRVSIPDMRTGRGINGTQVCDKLKATTGDFTTANSSVVTSNSASVSIINTDDQRIWVNAQTLIETDSVDALKAWLSANTPTLCYLLSEPIEYQLSENEIRTLLGDNNIWSDAGSTAIEYPADTRTYIDELSIKTVEVSGQTPTITAEENSRYICGEVTSLTFTPCETGICDVRFTSASISTVLTLPETVKLPDWFDPTSLEANTTYEINVVDGVYGAVMSWA